MPFAKLHCHSIGSGDVKNIAVCQYSHFYNLGDKINAWQAKLDSEINVRFLLNEHGDLYFLLHNNSVHIVLLNLKEN